MIFWQELDRKAHRTALISGQDVLSYHSLAKEADAAATRIRDQLPTDVTRPLILLETTNAVVPIVLYLAALRAGWPVILVPPGGGEPQSHIIQTYAPNVIMRAHDNWAPRITQAPQAALAPDLAVLLSTSGTTGAAKLVRLSKTNLATNAAAIATYLDVQPEDCTVTALPFHYSYGLSVLHIHLLQGAALVLTDSSVTDDDFWTLARTHHVSSLALVPTQYEMLMTAGFTSDGLPGLRYMTQAGGRLDPLVAKHFADMATANGWRLFIMYGQTEAGPRISYVPSADARAWGHTIGRPVLDTDITLIDPAGQLVTTPHTPGELVVTGPGVMMGYALSRADLALPQGPNHLATGDIAERLENGYFRIIGRSSRFLKLFGLRIGLDEVETNLQHAGFRVRAAGTDTGLVLFTTTAETSSTLQQTAAGLCKLPLSAVHIQVLDAIPLLPSGKVNYKALQDQAVALLATHQHTATEKDLITSLQSALRSTDLDMTKSFAEIGGDSLSYLEIQLLLADRLGVVPARWETLPLQQIIAIAETPAQVTPAWQPVAPDLLGRLVALVMVIALHATTWPTGGGAYLLLILSGFSVARFQAQSLFNGRVLRFWAVMLLPLTLCYYALITVTHVAWSPIELRWFFLLGNTIETVQLKGMVPYWFVCIYVQTLVLLGLPFLIPRLRQVIAADPFAAGLVALGAVAILMEALSLTDLGYPVRHRHPVSALELFLLGWGVYFAQTLKRQILIGVLVTTIYLLHWVDIDPQIGLVSLIGTGMILLNISVPLPRQVADGVMRMGQLTMFLYLLHTPTITVVSRLVPDTNWMQFGATLLITTVLAITFTSLVQTLQRFWLRSDGTAPIAKA